jgi:hypothetical protein
LLSTNASRAGGRQNSKKNHIGIIVWSSYICTQHDREEEGTRGRNSMDRKRGERKEAATTAAAIAAAAAQKQKERKESIYTIQNTYFALD